MSKLRVWDKRFLYTECCWIQKEELDSVEEVFEETTGSWRTLMKQIEKTAETWLYQRVLQSFDPYASS